MGLLSVVLAVASACGDNARDEPVNDQMITPAPGGGGGPPNDGGERTLLRPGEWVPPSASREAIEKGRSANLAESEKPKFDGEISGFRLYDFFGVSSGVEYPNGWCNANKYEPVEAFELTYVPEGTFTIADQFKGICANGADGFVSQEFFGEYASWTVTYNLLEKAIPSHASTERVSPFVVQGRPGVVAEPVIPEGNGSSFVAFEFGKGWLFIEALDMPLDETLKIAEGVRCVAC
jgi:hypothetical protein